MLGTGRRRELTAGSDPLNDGPGGGLRTNPGISRAAQVIDTTGSRSAPGAALGTTGDAGGTGATA